MTGSGEDEKEILYSHLLQLAHDAPRSIERVALEEERRTAVAELRDGRRLRATYPLDESVLDLERLLGRAGIRLERE